MARFLVVARDINLLQSVKLLEDFVLRECGATSLGNRFLTMLDNILVSSSGVEMHKKNRLPIESASCTRRLESSATPLCRHQNPSFLFPLQQVTGAFHQEQSGRVFKLTSNLLLRLRVGVDEVVPLLLMT